MGRAKADPPDGLVSLRTAADLCGCASDPRLIVDLERMRLVDPVVIVRGGRRFVRVRDLDYIRGWVQWWADRPQRPKTKRRAKR